MRRIAIVTVVAACALGAAGSSWEAGQSAASVGHLSAASDPCGPNSNPIVCENSKPGSPPSAWQTGSAGDPTIQGFATDISVTPGNAVSFKVNTDASAYVINIFRLGWYQGNGARFIASVQPSASLPQTQPACATDASVGLVDCGNWAVSASWTVPSDAVSGVYIADLERTDTGGVSQVPFVVRVPSNHSDVLFQTNDADWEAYNTYGGSSFYRPTTATRATKVSYNRPYNTRINDPLSYLFGGEYPMIRFLEENGYDVSYGTDVDASRYPTDLLNHKVLLTSGHSEYWSGEERAAWTAARNAGVNLAFFTGNEMFWKTRWENSTDGSNTPYRTLVTYKSSLDNANTDPSGIWTGEWRDQRFTSPTANTPENALTGTLFTANGYVESAVQVPVAMGLARFWRDTGVSSAPRTVSLPTGTLGYEWDADVDNGYRPAGLFDLSSVTEAVSDVYSTAGFDIGPQTRTHSMTMYKAPSGALVFSSGTVQLSWGLDAMHDTHSSIPPQPPSPIVQQATVNVLADMHAQPATLMSGLTPESASTDTTPPTTTISAPAANATIPQGSPYTISGTSTDAGGGVVTGVEVSTDGGTTWHPASVTTAASATWSYTWTPPVGPLGPATIQARAVDDSGNLESSPASVTVNLTTRICPCSAFDPTAVPAIPAQGDSNGIEVGVKFRSDVSGYITGVRFYKGVGNSGQHIASLWSSSGTLLARAGFAGESATGWQQTTFDAPVAIQANTTYVVSYYAPSGHYALTRPFFTSSVYNAPIRLLQDGADGPNGLYSYGAQPTFPTASTQSANYWVDPVFDTIVRPDTTPPVVVSSSPASGAAGVDARVAPSVQFSEGLAAATVTSGNVFLTDASGNPVPGSVAYNDTTRSITFTPTNALPYNSTYTLRVVGGSGGIADKAGNVLARDLVASFATGGAPNCPCTIWNSASHPVTAASADGSSVEVGVKFRTDLPGYVTGIRFYKGAGNGGTHVGDLWTSSGFLLERGTFTSETATGWQELDFPNPVPITPGTTYVASYLAPQGHYAADKSVFTSAVFSSPLQALADGFDGANGVYTYGSSPVFPTNGSSATNYWVGPVFSMAAVPDTTPPNVSSVTPARGAATGIDPNSATVTASFDEAIDPSTVTPASFTLSSQAGTVSATVAYNASTRVATLTPIAPLAWGTTYTATIKSGSGGVKDLAGNSVASDYTWTFTTRTCPCSIFTTQAPAQSSASDSNGIEVGVRFQSNVAGYVTGIRFYKGAGNGGTHYGDLWSNTGSLLARAAFTGEGASGWQQVTFDSPVPISSNTTYVAAYYAPQGHYALTKPGLATAIVNSPLTALADGAGGSNGVYTYSASPSFPTSTSGSANYWVDVLFNPTPAPDTTPPTVVATTPASGATGVDTAAPVTVAFSEGMNASTINASDVTLTGPGGAVAAAVNYNSATRTATLTPSSPLSYSTSYTVSVLGGVGGPADLAGNRMASTYTATFTTVVPNCPCSLFAPWSAPATLSSTDHSSVELGMRFRSDLAGSITAIRFYKGAGNTGVHVGSLWTSSGTLLASRHVHGRVGLGLAAGKSLVPGCNRRQHDVCRGLLRAGRRVLASRSRSSRRSLRLRPCAHSPTGSMGRTVRTSTLPRPPSRTSRRVPRTTGSTSSSPRPEPGLAGDEGGAREHLPRWHAPARLG